MRIDPSIVIGSVAAAFAVLATPAAIAQRPQAAIQLAKVQVASSAAATPTPAGKAGSRWVCAAQAQIQIFPVSLDVVSDSEAYVVVHLEKGEPVSSERVSARDVEALRSLGCKPAEKQDFIG